MVIVTIVPRVLVLFGMLLGEMLVMVGNTSYVNAAEEGALVNPSTVTVGCTTPAACAGMVIRQSVGSMQETPVASTPPKFTVMPVFRLVPSTQTVMPPVV